jgi:hypothetical protein
MKQHTPKWIYEMIDVHLKNSESEWYTLGVKDSVSFDTELSVIQAKLKNVRSIGFSPEDFSSWKVKLLVLSETIQPKLIAISGTDISLTTEDLEDLLHAFPTTQFWLTNFIGSHPRCTILPIGNSIYDHSRHRPKDRLLCITYLRPHSEDRMDLYKVLNKNLLLLQYFCPFLEPPIYNELLSRSRFSLCPSGNGYDTYRFWESLCYGAVPIVKQNIFYKELRRQYPKLPFLYIDEWKDLEEFISTLTPELYASLWKDADISPCWMDYWVPKFNALVGTP